MTAAFIACLLYASPFVLMRDSQRFFNSWVFISSVCAYKIIYIILWMLLLRKKLRQVLKFKNGVFFLFSILNSSSKFLA